MSLDVRGLIERGTGNCNIVSAKDNGFGAFTHMRYAICNDVMMQQCDDAIVISHRGKIRGGRSTLRFAISHQRRSNGVRRVLTKLQINLVIPEKHTYGYISTKAGIHTYMGIFITFLIRGGK